MTVIHLDIEYRTQRDTVCLASVLLQSTIGVTLSHVAFDVERLPLAPADDPAGEWPAGSLERRPRRLVRSRKALCSVVSHVLAVTKRKHQLRMRPSCESRERAVLEGHTKCVRSSGQRKQMRLDGIEEGMNQTHTKQDRC